MEFRSKENRRRLFDVKRALSTLHGSLAGRFLLGLMLASLILLFKVILLEPASWFQSLRLLTYEGIQKSISSRNGGDQPVTLVDISAIPRTSNRSVAPGEAPDESAAVSREYLLARLTEIASAHPAAIGVDVDFSPDSFGNPITMNDPGFFQKCRELSSKTGVPIFLGVDRWASQQEGEWLGGTDNASMAAGLAVGNDKFQGFAADMERPVDQVIRMFCWTQSRGTGTRLRTIAFALSQAKGGPNYQPPPWLSWAIEFEATYIAHPGLETEGFVVDYHLLAPLVHSAIPITSSMSAAANRFRDQVVILGNIAVKVDQGQQLTRGADIFRVPGKRGLYSGVLLHGCSVDTLLDSPLRQWTTTGRVVADLLLAGTAISLIEFFGWVFFRKKDRSHHDFRIHWSVTALIVVTICLFSVPFAGTFRLIWDDVAFVAFGLVAHTAIDHSMASHLHTNTHGEQEERPLLPAVGNETAASEPPVEEEAKLK